MSLDPGPPHGVLRRAAPPAKVNLVLEVLGRRPDGYHELRSLMAPLALADTLTVRPGRRSGRDLLRQAGEPCGPADQNLVLRAAALLREWSGLRLPPLHFELTKRIPAGAGLGGGSSDAAWALRLAAAAWGLRPGARELRALALDLGSDVPFFLLDAWGLVGGRGERLRRVPAPGGSPLGILLITPPTRLVTRDVFLAHDARAPLPAGRSRDGGGPSATLAARLGRGLPASQLLGLEPANDLWPAAASLLPQLQDLRTGLGRLLARPVHLSGSGPTLFVLYASPQTARRAGSRLRAAIRDGTFPVAGAPPDVIASATRGGPA